MPDGSSSSILNSCRATDSPKITEKTSPDLDLNNSKNWLLPIYEASDTMETMWNLPSEELECFLDTRTVLDDEIASNPDF